MKKAIIFSCIMVLLSSSFAFAQSERNGTIIGTLGAGLAIRTTGTGTNVLGSSIMELNLISKEGFTLCITDVTTFTASAASRYMLTGTGYHYMRPRWNIGVALLIAPMAGELMFGGRINGGFYFTDNIGISSTLVYSRTMIGHFDFSMFNFLVGPSIRLF